MTTVSTFNQSIKLDLEVDKSAVTLIRLQSAHKNDEEEASHDIAVGLALVRFNDLVLPQFCNLL